MKYIIASKNINKIKEIKSILKGYDLISLNDIDYSDEIEENGKSFEENAIIKAKTIYDKYHIPVISDDSGLCVSQLNGMPGIYSHRFAKENASDEENNEKLLKMMENIIKRDAYFKCVICLYDGTIHLFDGCLNGEITKYKMGENGFGYDPYFFIKEYNKTLAQMDFDLKNKISHRYKALFKLKEYLDELSNNI